jgi:hypothetical protein
MTEIVTHGIDEDDTEINLEAGAKWPPHGVTEASEPLSRGKRPQDSEDMLSPSALHKYAQVLLVIALGIAMVMIEVQERSPWWEILTIGSFGWALGQLWRWEPPR